MKESVNCPYLRKEGLVVGWRGCEKFLLFSLPLLTIYFLKPRGYDILNEYNDLKVSKIQPLQRLKTIGNKFHK